MPDRDVANPVLALAQSLDNGVDTVAHDAERVGRAPVNERLNQYVPLSSIPWPALSCNFSLVERGRDCLSLMTVGYSAALLDFR